ncbi:MAG TPA: hydroxymethylpyrimidine/phosphomethylpyrimidine kinase [Flavobacterium sp.]|nr:hydroxymethylpyrimidine/phosphomethylpyrimidine kinase [Flavobacterium sp.]
MSASRPFVLSIAGFDPTAGAGVLADVKTFEQHQVYGLSIITGNTIQTENEFQTVEWTPLQFVLNSIAILFGNYNIKAVKIGIVPSLDHLKSIVDEIRKYSKEVKIVWDTVLKSSTEFEFITIENQSDLNGILDQMDLITPNYNEMLKLVPQKTTPEEIGQSLSKHCAVLLKGGHNPGAVGIDYLYTGDEHFSLNPKTITVMEKHGTGCVLSSAITANLALNHDLPKSCQKAKLYIEHYLNTNNTLLGYHYV